MKLYIKVALGVCILLMLIFLSNLVVNSANYEKQGLSLPGGYPQDLIPLLEGHKIVSWNRKDLGAEQELWVKYIVNIGQEEIDAFYQNIFNRGVLKDASQMGRLYTLDGEIGGKAVDIKITTEKNYDNYQSNVNITITGEFADLTGPNGSGTIDMSTANQNVTSLDRVPEEYPLDLLPMYGGSRVTSGQKFDYNNIQFVIQIYVKDDKEQVSLFYQEVLKDAENREEGIIDKQQGTLYTLGGVMNRYKVSYVISDLNIQEIDYNTLINISVDVLE